ncbi:hypothetical protein CVT26_006105 [Gymnopilus dilepis]|uniref:Uncharacterized protein n=1 Tax=Gymnopilus dilepis TaxID=231916 RepID=A0A409YKG2_9AGAR|nr:hypothetical protein CVT26_006105 [Gymnopilus dilepis]
MFSHPTHELAVDKTFDRRQTPGQEPYSFTRNALDEKFCVSLQHQGVTSLAPEPEGHSSAKRKNLRYWVLVGFGLA